MFKPCDTLSTTFLIPVALVKSSITYTGGAALGVKLRENINYALTANPGGVLAKVKIPAGLTVTAIALA